jgi:hypothetical protein
MPYSAEISRTNPTCFLFLIDQSSSMDKPFGGTSTKKKAEGVADAINRLLQALVFRCTKGMDVLDRYHVGVIGYGPQVGPALGGELTGRNLAPISEIAQKPLRVETRTRKVDDGAGGLVSQTVKFPVWFEALAKGKTPMCAALDLAWSIVNDFVMDHRGCYPPMVINITDGEATDGDPRPHAAMIRELSSEDGNVLLFNLHLSSRAEAPIQFPAAEAGLPDDFARRLFRMSSPLPPMMVKAAQGEHRLSDGAAGFVFNADLVSVIEFLDIGTRSDWTLPMGDEE